MGKIKQIVKPYYYAIKSTHLYSIVNNLSNLFLRHNNLAFSLIKARMQRNKIILGKNVILRHCRFEIHGTDNIVIISDNCKLSGVRIFINSGKNKLAIGKNTIVNASKKQQTLFNPCNGGEISIGERCLFSNNIEIHTTDYHKILLDGQQVNFSENIQIGSHCWIGLQCLILKGTYIGDNVIVGARSLLNKKIEESNCVVAGNPAKVVKRGIAWDF